MTALARFWDECRVLGRGTRQAWLSLLPLLLLLQLLAWGSYQGSLAAAAWVASDQPWLALAVFSMGFVLALVVAVVMMRVVGDHLGSADMVPGETGSDHDSDNNVGLNRMLALTMLPLLATYAAFGYVADGVNELTLMSFAYYGGLGDNLLALLSPNRAGVFTVLGVLVGAYAARRLLDAIYQRTNWRFLGILVTITEAFFVMGLVLAAARWFSDLRYWLMNREFMAWWDAALAGLGTAFAAMRIDLPAFLVWFGPLWQDHIFPGLVQALTEPLIWLAVAALVFGSRVISVADLWRKGQPLVTYVPGASKLTLARRMAATAEAERGRGINRKAMVWIQENLFGDIDDKYLPTLHAVRLVLKAGLPFLGAFLLVYNAISLAKSFFRSALINAIGGHDILFWLGVMPGVDLVVDLFLETLRLTLLAVAFHRCLQLFRSHAHASDYPVPAPMPRRSPMTGAINQWRRLRGSLVLVLVVWLIAGAGWSVSNLRSTNWMDYRDGAINETVSLGAQDITVLDVQYGTIVGPLSVGTTPGRWVNIQVRVSSDGAGAALRGELRANGKTYHFDGGLMVLGDGKWTVFDMLFEVPADDLDDLELVVYPRYETFLRVPAARIDLRLAPETAEYHRNASEWLIVDHQSSRAQGGN